MSSAAQHKVVMPSGPALKQLAQYTYQGQLKEFAFSCLPCFYHKLLANINGVTRSSLSRLLRKPLGSQKGTHILLGRCQQGTNKITTAREKHANFRVPRGPSHSWGFHSSCVHASGFRQILEQLVKHRALKGSNCPTRSDSSWLNHFPTPTAGPQR